jgi:hypothetical protein
MTTIQSITINRTYKNNGQHSQQTVDFTLTGQLRKADNHKWNIESDIPELNMSVKADRFTLASDLMGETLSQKINDYFDRTASTSWAYITNEGQIYIMNRVEFYAFLMAFTTLQRQSSKNGGHYTVKLNHETNKVREWLKAQV